MERCEFGKYCNVDLTDKFTKELSYTTTHTQIEYTVLYKSILLDRQETSMESCNEDDPLCLSRNCKIYLDIGLVQLLGHKKHLMLANLYHIKKVCFNCYRALAIIDAQRNEQLNKPIESAGISTSRHSVSNSTIPKLCTKSAYTNLEIKRVQST